MKCSSLTDTLHVFVRVRREAEAGTCGVDHHPIHEFMEQASRLEEEPRNFRNKRVREVVCKMFSEVVTTLKSFG